MSPTPPLKRRKTTTRLFQQKKQRKEPITMITAYDYAIARAVDEAEIDAILVGDSVGMVVLGYETTLPVTMADMLHHCKAVARGASYALLIGDMPFMSYQASVEEAVRNAGRFLQEAGMDAIKLEGGRERLPAIRAILEAGIPVMGHLGLTPQSVHQFGGFRAQGPHRRSSHANLHGRVGTAGGRMLFHCSGESIPERLASRISETLAIPTIGIGAGAGCDGQVLVVHDVLGLFDRFVPKFVKQYADLWTTITGALQTYAQEVREAAFPGEEHTLQMPDDEWEAFLNAVK